MKSYTEAELIVVRQSFCKTNYPDFQYIGRFGSDDEVIALTMQMEMSGQTLLDTEPSMNLETKWWQSLQTGEAILPTAQYIPNPSTPLVKPQRRLNRSVDQGFRSPRYLSPNSLVNKTTTGRVFHLKI
ncbi:MAG: hypothetical protein V1897_05525 [Pseudomonadota bacterium]